MQKKQRGGVKQAKLEGGEASDKVKEWGKEFELKIDAADMEITFHKSVWNEWELMWRMKRETKETLLVRQYEEQLNFERQQQQEIQSSQRKRLLLRVNRMSNFLASPWQLVNILE